MDPLKAENRDAWRRWLAENHQTADEVWLLFYKKHTAKTSVSYDEAVEEALCYGWIDSTIRRVDEESYAQKFTSRKTGSKWSASNLARMEKLVGSGKVTEVGMTVYLSRSREKPGGGKPARHASQVPPDLESALKTGKLAWKNFRALPPSHQRQYILWITSARKPETRKKRISKAVELIENSTASMKRLRLSRPPSAF